MQRALSNLLSVASNAICESPDSVDELKKWGTIGEQLGEMLVIRNGFYAFESALLVRPFQYDQDPPGLREWNAPSLWKREFAQDAVPALFFAEDAFGGQYCVRDETICTFNT